MTRYQTIIVLAEGGHAVTVKCRNVVIEDGKRMWIVSLVPYAISSSRDHEPAMDHLVSIIGKQFHNTAAVRVAVKRAVRTSNGGNE